MAARSLHSLLPLVALASLLHLHAAPLFLAFYIGSVLRDMARALHLVVFAPTVNVYVDGVYDMFHVGHVNVFRNSLKFGTRLVVGVLSDQDVAAYKRAPVMTMAERIA